MPSDNHVIILVHGIRDFALWQNRIRKVLEPEFVVESTNYGRFDVVRFLIPGPFFRDRAIEKVWDQIRDIKIQNQDSKISFIAHSFGTYIVADILRREFDFEAYRIAFCGSVVRYDYPFEQISKRFTSPILNEVGARDPWPALAESVTWGYGSAGTYGFRRPRVRDRWHTNAGHSYFLDPAFCSQYWIPFFRDGKIVDGAENPEDPSWWLKATSIIPVKYAIFALLVLSAIVFVPRNATTTTVAGTPESHVCYPYEPAKDEPDQSRPGRECQPGRLTYVKWIDEDEYPAVDRPTGRWPNDRANRSISMTKIDVDGTPAWVEQNLLRVVAGHRYWQPPSTGEWTEIVADSADVVPGQSLTLLRRQDPDQTCDAEKGGKRRLLEMALPSGLDQSEINDGVDTKMCFRWVTFRCQEKRPLRIGDSKEPFTNCVGRVVRAVKDR